MSRAKTSRLGRSLAMLAALLIALVAAALVLQPEVFAAPSPGGALAYEAEGLPGNEQATAPLGAPGNCCGLVWPGDAQLWLLADGPNDTFDVLAGGSYGVSAYLARARDYGTHALAVDGKPLVGISTATARRW